MLTYHAYAAPSAKAPLEPFAFDPGPLGPEEVEIEVSHCGLCQLSSLGHAQTKQIQNYFKRRTP